jgi:hypothetical protein
VLVLVLVLEQELVEPGQLVLVQELEEAQGQLLTELAEVQTLEMVEAMELAQPEEVTPELALKQEPH